MASSWFWQLKTRFADSLIVSIYRIVQLIDELQNQIIQNMLSEHDDFIEVVTLQ